MIWFSNFHLHGSRALLFILSDQDVAVVVKLVDYGFGRVDLGSALFLSIKDAPANDDLFWLFIEPALLRPVLDLGSTEPLLGPCSLR